MIVNSVNTSYQTYTTSTKGNNELGKDDFLKLLILQMQNQDPLEPMKNEDFIAQLAQFGSLEQMQNLNKTMSSLANLQILSQTASLIGKHVRVLVADGRTIQGIVDAVDFSDGIANLVVKAEDGKDYLVAIDKILSIK